MTDLGILVFRTNSATIRAERLLRQAALEVKAIPDPRQVAAACGLAVRFPWELRDHAQQLVRDGGLDLVAAYRLDASALGSDDSLPAARRDS